MMEFEPTPIETLEKHYNVAKKEGLRFTYIGNVPGHPYENTYCPECNYVVVNRYGFNILSWNLDKNNCCIQCKCPIPINGSPSKTSNRKKRYFQILE
jgi:pyruvate formate lyase activating enzyme